MNKKDRKAVIDALTKQIRLVEQQGNLDQAEKLKAALDGQIEDQQFPDIDLAELDQLGQVKRNYDWNASLPKQLHQARVELAHAQLQLDAWNNQGDAQGVRYWQQQLARAQHTLAELTAYLAKKRPDVLQNEGDYKPSPLEEHFAPYEPDASDIRH